MSLLADVVATSAAVAATRARSEKVAHLARLLAELEGPTDVACAVSFLVGEPRQGRVGVGWRSLASALDGLAPAGDATLTIAEVDAAVATIAGAAGAGSQGVRRQTLRELFGRATEAEAAFLRALLTGELRQGALAGVVTDAVAKAAGVGAPVVRRAVMLAGDLPHVAALALTEGEEAVAAIHLQPLRAVQPMLASTSASVTEAMADLGGRAVSIEWTLAGARVQAHRQGAEVRLFTRTLNDVTDRLPGVVGVLRDLEVEAVVLDGEVLGLGIDDDRPDPFQDTMSRFGQKLGDAGATLSVRFFDLLHLDGRDLIDDPLADRLAALDRVVGPWRVPGIVTDDVEAAEAFAESALTAGHEGVMVKDVTSTYEAGRRGASWRKVKPVHTLDLVVLAAEWGHGRRQGWLSNLHLGARAEDGSDDLVMVGKTFKGLTDSILTWQTEQLLAREVRRDGITVHVRPELVVEVAVDGVQASSRYDGGVTLRFARIKGYRPDKASVDADTIDAVRALGR